MIARTWRGVTKREHAQDYIEYLEGQTFPRLATMDGFVKATLLRREVAHGTELLAISVWQSEQAIKQFAGETPTRAVVPDQVRALLVEYDEFASHYEVVDEFQV